MVELLAPLQSPLRSPFQPVAASGDAFGAPPGTEFNSFSPIKKILAEDSGDVTILVLGDSMTDSQSEFGGSMALNLAARYFKPTIDWISWDDSGLVWSAPTRVRTGPGSRRVNIYNAAVGGQRSAYFMGSKFAAVVAALDPQLIVLVYGLNHVGAGNFANTIRSEFLETLEELRPAKPAANIAWVVENPKRDDTSMEVITEFSTAVTTKSMLQILQREKTLQPDLTLIDAYSKFIAAGKDTSLYSDATHGNTVAGMALYMRAFDDTFDAAKSGPFAPAAPLMATIGTSLLSNGDFTAWPGAVPTGWVASTGVVMSKEVTNKYGAHAYAARVTGGVTAAPNLKQTIIGAGLTAAIANGLVTVAARVFVPTGAATTVGRTPSTFVSSANTGSNARAALDGPGRYRWRFYADLPIGGAATGIQVICSQDTAAVPDTTHPIDIDRVICVVGSMPKDIAE